MHAEAHAVRAARQARALEQLVGNVETVGHVVFAHIVGIEPDGLEQTAERACSGLAVAIHDVAQDHLAIGRIGVGLAHFFLVVARGVCLWILSDTRAWTDICLPSSVTSLGGWSYT